MCCRHGCNRHNGHYIIDNKPKIYAVGGGNNTAIGCGLYL